MARFFHLNCWEMHSLALRAYIFGHLVTVLVAFSAASAIVS